MISINLYEIIMHMVNFLILLVLLNKFLIRPLSEFIEKRSAGIASDLENAEKNKADSEALLAEQKELVQKALVEAKDIRHKAEDLANKEKAQIIEDANANAEQLVANAKREIELSVEKAKKELTNNVGELAVKLSEMILQKELDNKSKETIIADGLKKLKVS